MVSGCDVFLSLFHNLAFFVLLVVLYGFIVSKLGNIPVYFKQLILGVLFGLCAIGCIYVDIPVASGVFIDQRNTVIMLSGAFGGPLSALLAAALAALYRFQLGGAGVAAGIIGIHLAGFTGIGLFFIRPWLDSIPKVCLASFTAVIVTLPAFMFVGDFHDGWNLTKSMALPYGGAVFLSLVVTGLLLDNEERRHAATAALVKSEEMFRSMYERMMDVIYQTDMKGKIVAISPSVGKMFGCNPDDVLGKDIRLFYRDASRRDTFVSEILKNGFVENFECEIRKRDGSYLWVSTNASLVREKDGAPLGIEGVTRDISALKKSELEKADLEDALRQRQKIEAVGTLAGGIAHDFNNILGAIMGFGDLLREDLREETLQREYIDNILVAAERAKDLTQQLLTFSQKQRQARTSIDIRVVVTESINRLKKTVPATIKVSTSLAPYVGRVFGNAGQIHQLVINLCTNAVFALKQKGGEISIALFAHSLSREETDKNRELVSKRYAVLAISDNGVGIPPDVLPRIFEPFFTTRTVGSGTGMGLSVVHGIVKSHGGTVEVDSEVGIGTRFRVFLPIQDDRVSAEPDPDDDAASRGCERILIVNNEPLIVDLAAEILSKSGYHIETTCSVGRALESFRLSPNLYDLVIADHAMPEMTGETLALEMMRIRPDMPIIAVTDYRARCDAEKAHAVGIRAFVTKPFSKDELKRVVRNVLDEGMC